MRILFDQGTPVPLRASLTRHDVRTASEMGWSRLDNGELLAAAEGAFEAFVTTDRGLLRQQNLTGRQLAIPVLPTTSWPRLRRHVDAIAAAVDALQPGEHRELELPS